MVMSHLHQFFEQDAFLRFQLPDSFFFLLQMLLIRMSVHRRRGERTRRPMRRFLKRNERHSSSLPLVYFRGIVIGLGHDGVRQFQQIGDEIAIVDRVRGDARRLDERKRKREELERSDSGIYFARGELQWVGVLFVFHFQQTIDQIGFDVIESVARLNEQIAFDLEALHRPNLEAKGQWQGDRSATLPWRSRFRCCEWCFDVTRRRGDVQCRDCCWICSLVTTRRKKRLSSGAEEHWPRNRRRPMEEHFAPFPGCNFDRREESSATRPSSAEERRPPRWSNGSGERRSEGRDEWLWERRSEGWRETRATSPRCCGWPEKGLCSTTKISRWHSTAERRWSDNSSIETPFPTRAEYRVSTENCPERRTASSNAWRHRTARNRSWSCPRSRTVDVTRRRTSEEVTTNCRRETLRTNCKWPAERREAEEAQLDTSTTENDELKRSDRSSCHCKAGKSI